MQNPAIQQLLIYYKSNFGRNTNKPQCLRIADFAIFSKMAEADRLLQYCYKFICWGNGLMNKNVLRRQKSGVFY